MLYLALGILGATVMPHNLYLHSGLVQTRGYGDTPEEKREAISLATINSTIALCFAFVINASILILAAATFHRAGQHRRRRARPGAFLPGAAARLDLGADAVCDRAALLRTELDHHRDAVGPDRDGGFSELAHRAMAAAHGDADDRDPAGRDRDDLVPARRRPGSC